MQGVELLACFLLINVSAREDSQERRIEAAKSFAQRGLRALSGFHIRVCEPVEEFL